MSYIDSNMGISVEGMGRTACLLDLCSAAVVVGSKRHPASQMRHPRPRQVQSLAYPLLVRTLLRVKVRGSQTGFKMFRRKVAERIMDAALVKRFAFDLDLLVLAPHVGFRRILEAPIRINYKILSSTSPRAVFRMLWETPAIFDWVRILRSYDLANPRGLNRLMDDLWAHLSGE